LPAIMVYSNEICYENAEHLIGKLNELQFTDIFFVAKNMDGKVYYSSKLAEASGDKLSLLCKLAADYNMDITAWFCTFTEGYTGRLFGEGTSRFLKENPDAAAVNVQGRSTIEEPVRCDQGLENYACPANPLVQRHELALIREIIRNYPIKGIHLDFVRYPFPGDYCYCTFCKNKFKQDFGPSAGELRSQEHKAEWQQQIISEFISKAKSEIKSFNEDTRVSALVWKYNDCLNMTQDWRNWNVDFVTPMFYNKSYLRSIEWIRGEIAFNARISNRKIVAAVGGPYSELFTKSEWDRIEKAVSSTESEGVLYGHYGLASVIQGLENGKFNSLKRRLKWQQVSGTMRLKFFFGRAAIKALEHVKNKQVKR